MELFLHNKISEEQIYDGTYIPSHTTYQWMLFCLCRLYCFIKMYPVFGILPLSQIFRK